MKITFINPTICEDYSALDLAITSLATFINQYTKHKADIIDLTFRRRFWKRYLKKELLIADPDIIGISANTLYMGHIKEIIAWIKSFSKNMPFVLGGYHASLMPEDSISIEGVKYVIIGDGEIPLNRLLDRLEEGENCIDIPGIWEKTSIIEKENKLKSHAITEIHKNNLGKFYRDISNLPYLDYSLWKDLDLYYYFLGMLYTIGSRGCPYHCSYCDAHGISKSVNGQYYRVIKPEVYVEQLEYYFQNFPGFRLFQFFDQIFTANKIWLEKFTKAYKKSSMYGKIKYSVFSRIDHLNEEKIKLLADGGCAILRVGIESGNDFIRNEIYGKNISKQKIIDVRKFSIDNGIKWTAYYILGGPAENKYTTNDTIRFARKINAERSAFFIYKPFTEEGVRQILKYGGKVDEEKYRKADNITFTSVIELKDLSTTLVNLYQIKAYFFTFGLRLLKMIKRKHIFYPIEFIIYITRGLAHKLSIFYLLIYYHIYGYDNVDK